MVAPAFRNWRRASRTLIGDAIGGSGSVAVADVPHAPAAVGVSVADFDRLLPLGAGVGCPTIAVEVVAVAGIPD